MRMIWTLVAGALLATSAQAATLQEWRDAQLESVLTVTRTDAAGVYRVTAVLRDAATAKVFTSPSLRVASGKAGTIETGIDKGPEGSFFYRLRITVADSGDMATFSSQFMRDGRVTGMTSGSLAVQPDGAIQDVPAHPVMETIPPKPPGNAGHAAATAFLPVEVGLIPVHDELADVQQQLRSVRLALEDATLEDPARADARRRLAELERRAHALQAQAEQARARGRNPLVNHLAAL